MNERLTSPPTDLDDRATVEPGLAPPEPAVASAGLPDDETVASAASEPAVEIDADIDLVAIERDLNDVQAALERLNDGSYWTDEVTGEPIADDVLAAHPTARTATPALN